MEFGLSTFGEVQTEQGTGNAKNAYRRTQELIQEAMLADRIGLDVFALGEHHRPDYMISAPEVLLASMATVTERIRLSSAVTVLSSADPVRTYQNFATLDLVSGGRAEIMAGRGSFIESFPLFGYDLEDYDDLFSEKLDLLLNINEHQIVNWKGKFRSPLKQIGVYPGLISPGSRFGLLLEVPRIRCESGKVESTFNHSHPWRGAGKICPTDKSLPPGRG